MDEQRLKQLAERFTQELQTSENLQAHLADHRRRQQRAQAMLTEERIPALTADDLRQLFFDSDAFGFWSNKEWEFNNRLQKSGLDGLCSALLELVMQGELGMTAHDLQRIWSMRGLGKLLSTELLSYRFPDRYWTYYANVILPAFLQLGDDVKASQPHGQQSDSFLYMALESRLTQVRQALVAAGSLQVDYLLADIFLWWVNKTQVKVTKAAPMQQKGSGSTTSNEHVWLFQVVPERYDLVTELKARSVGEKGNWTVSRYRNEMHAGDPVILWQGGRKAGIYAIGELTGESYQRGPERTVEELTEKPYLRSEWVFNFRYTHILEEPILRNVLKAHSTLSGLEILRFAQATNFRVTPEQWEALQELIGPGAQTDQLPNPGYQDGAPAGSKQTSQLQRIPLVRTGDFLVSRLAHERLQFTRWQLATFYTALQTKGFVILSGISGTGKTRLAQAFAGMLPQPAEGANHLFVTVRPDWRDSKSLLGYYNPLTGTYEWTPFLRFLLRAEQNYKSADKLAWFVILDEMNLAHVEYYFADLLSVLESGRDEDGWTREPLRMGYPDEAKGNLPPPELKLPPNLYIVGTVNVDETTHAFSPKVLDRAFTLELTDVDFRQYQPTANLAESVVDAATGDALLRQFSRDGKFARVEKDVIANYVRIEESKAQLQTLNDLLCLHDIHFGYRIFDEIVAFLAAAESNKLYDDHGGAEAAFDAAVMMKVLPKFHGSRSRLETPLCAVMAWCADPGTPDIEAIEEALQAVGSGKRAEEALEDIRFLYPETARRAQRMLDRLYTDGFAAFG
jgi:hypothetical protein